MSSGRLFLAGVLCLALGSAAWARDPIPRHDRARLSALATATVGKDFRINWHLEKNAQICGGEGDAWIGQVEMNTYRRAIGGDRRPAIQDHWVKLDKWYSIYVGELSDPNPQLFDHDNCLE